MKLIASSQYGMQFILSQDNEIVARCDGIPYEKLELLAEQINKFMERKKG